MQSICIASNNAAVIHHVAIRLPASDVYIHVSYED